MGAVIGEILPLALGVAISPIPIIAAILMLLSPKARVTSVGFLLGWVLGIVVAVTVFTLLSSILPSQDADDSKPTQGVIQLVLGAGLILLALRQWRGRPKAGEEPAMPKWMQAIDKVTFPVAFGLGFPCRRSTRRTSSWRPRPASTSGRRGSTPGRSCS